MPQPSVTTDLLESLEIITHLLVDSIGKDVRVLPVDEVFLSVEEPVGDLELGRVLHDSDDSLELVGVEFAGTEAIISAHWSGTMLQQSSATSRRRQRNS